MELVDEDARGSKRCAMDNGEWRDRIPSSLSTVNRSAAMTIMSPKVLMMMMTSQNVDKSVDKMWTKVLTR